MSFESRNTRAGAVREDGFSAVAGVDVTMGRAAQAQAPAATTAPKSMSAAEAVRQVLDVADQVAASRSTVDVKLQLDHARVSVRVEYRSDQVHVTFRTDSAEMREALSQAWQAQSASAEKKSYTFAEPVFANAAPTPVASSGSSQGFSLGDGARQQSQSQSQQQQQQSRSSEAGGASFLSTLAGIRSRPTAPVSTEARPVVSTDSARLQAFA